MNDTSTRSPRRRIAVTSRGHTLVALLAAGSLFTVVSCGDDDADTAATTLAAAPSTSEAAPETTSTPPTSAAVSATTAPPETTVPESTVPETTEALSEESPDAYCAAAAEIESLDGAPTLEQFQAYAELAPGGIADTVGEVLAAYEGVNGDLDALVGNDEFLDWLDEIDAFETDYCGLEPEDEATTSKPDDPYCQIALELFNQDDFPTAEQLQAYSEVAPADIAGPVDVVIAGFEEADGNFGELFSDPAFVEAIGALEGFEFEYCGIGEAPAPVVQIDPNAIRVDVAATDYAFDFELPAEPGRYSFVMNNAGEEPHIMILLQLEEGADLDAVIASEGEEGVIVSFESDLAFPGSEAVINADLVAGDWVLLCPIPNAEDQPHFALGMIHEFTIN